MENIKPQHSKSKTEEVPAGEQREKIIKDELRPVLEPVFPLEDASGEFEEFTGSDVRTSGAGSYSESGVVEEGQKFSPERPTSHWPDEWIIKTTGTPKLAFAKHHVKIPRGTLFFQSVGTGSGYNNVILRRAGYPNNEHRIVLPVGHRPDFLFKDYPIGSFIALPGEAGIDHPEYQPKWHTIFSQGYLESRTAPTTLLLSRKNERWVEPISHPKATFKKTSSRRRISQGELTLTAENPEEEFALVRNSIGEPWQVITWEDAFGGERSKIIPWNNFTKLYKDKYGSEPPLPPEIEEKLPLPEAPIEGGEIICYLYRTKEGKLLGSPARPTGKGRSRNFIIEGEDVGALSPENSAEINLKVKPMGSNKLQTTDEWWSIPEEGDIDITMTYASGKPGDINEFEVSNVPEEEGLYAIYSSETDYDITPTSYQAEGGEIVVPVDLFEIYELLIGSNRPSSQWMRHSSEDEKLERQNSLVKRALEIYKKAQELGLKRIKIDESSIDFSLLISG